MRRATFLAILAPTFWAARLDAVPLPPDPGDDGKAAAEAKDSPKPREPTPEEVAQLQAAARKSGRGVVLVGRTVQGRGTGFLISRKHRLVVTAAHVADIGRTMFVVVTNPDGRGAHTHEVDRTWYHPAVLRKLDEDLSVRSPDPGVGEIEKWSPDLAVLRLAEGGPELPEAWELAGPEEVDDLPTRAAGGLGYSGGYFWETTGAPSATLRAGIIASSGTLFEPPNGLPAVPELVSTVEIAPGASGGPLFLPNGHIVGINYAQNLRSTMGQATRVDALWELLVHHKLDALVPIKQAKSRIRTFPEPETPARIAELRRALQQVHDAGPLAQRGEFRKATDACNEAIRIAPELGAAYMQRASVRTQYCGVNWGRLDEKDRHQQIQWANEDCRKGVELSFKNRSGITPAATAWLMLTPQLSIYNGLNSKDDRFFEEALAGADSALEQISGLGKPQRASLLGVRAQARQLLGDPDKALADYREAIRLAPDEPNLYENRAVVWTQQGYPDLATQDRARAVEIRRMKGGR